MKKAFTSASKKKKKKKKKKLSARSSFRVVRGFGSCRPPQRVVVLVMRYYYLYGFVLLTWGLFSPEYKIPGEKKVVFDTLNKRDIGFQTLNKKHGEEEERKKKAAGVCCWDLFFSTRARHFSCRSERKTRFAFEVTTTTLL